jgi:RNA polymerase sigma-70 factor (ECF subfamily)
MADEFSETYRSTFPVLVRFLYRKLWDADRAEELAQEAFARAAERRPKKLRAWVFVVASNLARDHVRQEVRRRRHLVLLKSEPQSAPVRPDELVERSDETERVKTALDTLSPREREVLLLWDAGHSYGEIAQHTGLAAGAIGTTLARARRRLAEAYEELGERRVAR